jgi:hypothetical protein
MVMATQTVPLSLSVGNTTKSKAIKEQLRAQGVRLSCIRIRDIRAFADAHFAEHN